jgi:uncharacterized membrane protein YqhA
MINGIMKKFLAGTRYLVILAVISLLVASLAAFAWGLALTVDMVRLVITNLGHAPGITIALIEIVDAFLVAITLLVFGLGIYELVVSDLPLPDWMQIHNLHDLKAKLGGLLVLVMAVKFLEKLVEWKNGLETLFFALAIAAVAAAIIAFSALGGKD